MTCASGWPVVYVETPRRVWESCWRDGLSSIRASRSSSAVSDVPVSQLRTELVLFNEPSEGDVRLLHDGQPCIREAVGEARRLGPLIGVLPEVLNTLCVACQVQGA